MQRKSVDRSAMAEHEINNSPVSNNSGSWMYLLIKRCHYSIYSGYLIYSIRLTRLLSKHLLSDGFI
jgi:hypothetical protein